MGINFKGVLILLLILSLPINEGASLLNIDQVKFDWPDSGYAKLAADVGDSLTWLVADVIENSPYPRLVRSIIWKESRWDPQAIGNTADYGLMQVTLATALWVSDSLLVRGIIQQPLSIDDLFDPVLNVRAGIENLNRHLAFFADRPYPLVWALTAYNRGRRGTMLLNRNPPRTTYSNDVISLFSLPPAQF